MQMLKCLFVCCIIYASSNAQDYQDYQDNAPRQAPIRLRSNPGLSEHTRPTPVPILKQINKHNEDGSYTYGFEGADGSFKIETKLATGEVKGKYGYVDETGKVRVVEYGANKYGFQPSGEGITVAPPTLVDETRENDLPEYEDEPQVRPQRPHRVNRPQQQQQYRPVSQQPRQQPQYIQYDDEEAEPELPRRVQYATATSQHSQPQLQLQRASVAPLPPRIQVAGAQRVSDVLYTASPRPERPHFEYSQSTSFGDASGSVRAVRPSYAPAPAPPAPSSARAQGFLGPASGGRPHLEPFQYGPTQPSSPAQSAPQLGYHQPQPQQQPQFQSKSGTSSLLDQLARDYALPENSAQPLHDISFGYYQ